jgi:hypothetical protein
MMYLLHIAHAYSAIIAMCDSCGYPSLDLRTRADINTASLNMADDARCGTSIHGQEAQLCLSRMYTFRHANRPWPGPALSGRGVLAWPGAALGLVGPVGPVGGSGDRQEGREGLPGAAWPVLTRGPGRAGLMTAGPVGLGTRQICTIYLNSK